MAIARIVYTQGNVAVSGTTLNTCTSVSLTQDQPNESISVFGRIGAVDVVQTDPNTGEMEVGIALGVTSGLATLLNTLMNNTCTQSAGSETVTAVPVGSLATAWCTSLEAEASLGDVPSCTLGFAGTPTPNMDTSAQLPTAVTATVFSMATSENVTVGGLSQTDIQSATWSWEVPAEIIAGLGSGNINGQYFSNPPGTCSMDIEASEDFGNPPTPTDLHSLQIGDLTFNLHASSKVSSEEINLEVGELFGTYSVTIEGPGAGCTVS